MFQFQDVEIEASMRKSSVIVNLISKNARRIRFRTRLAKISHQKFAEGNLAWFVEDFAHGYFSTLNLLISFCGLNLPLFVSHRTINGMALLKETKYSK